MPSSPDRALLLALLSACAITRHPAELAPAPPASAVSWEEVLERPGVMRHEAIVAARWSAPLGGVVNRKHPEARALPVGRVPIVLALHVLVHPERGAFLVDTGVPEDVKGALRGPVRLFARDLEPGEPLARVLERVGAPLAGVLLTHLHFDHVLGLADVPPGTPIHAGPAETSARSFLAAAMRPTVGGALEGHGPLRTWDFAHAPAMAPFDAAVDVLGDGSLWALPSPGHTPGSSAYLALTTDGPALFVGDTSHTRWGWEHGVEPGWFTDDTEANARSLARLRGFVAEHPAVRVFVGHEIDGEGTGISGR